MAPAEHGADAGFELGERAGLHDVVVGPEVEDTDPLGLFGAAGEDDDGEGAVPAEPGEDLVAVDPGKTEVQKDQVVLAEAGFSQGRRAIDGLADVVADALEEEPGGGPGSLVVFGDEHGPLVLGHCHNAHLYTFVFRRLRLEPRLGILFPFSGGE
jgi:hypothetical protein